MRGKEEVPFCVSRLFKENKIDEIRDSTEYEERLKSISRLTNIQVRELHEYFHLYFFKKVRENSRQNSHSFS